MDINHWAEAISSMPEKQFFNIMRLYLGEIKTPYNKQRLISDLASFIKKPEHISSILSFLDKKDISVLTAISIIPKASQKTILEFFSGTYQVTEIYSELINLSERLLIYSVKDNYSDSEFFYINPLLAEALKPYFSVSTILPRTAVETYSLEDVFILSPNFLASFISFIQINGIGCKADGIIKKNYLNKLDEIFSGRTECIQLLMNAFINLNLVRENEKHYELDSQRLKTFASLDEDQQYALLCAASVSRFSREGLRREAQILLDAISSIPKTGFSRESIKRLAFLISSSNDEGAGIGKKSRFTRMLETAKTANQEELIQNANMLEMMIESAVQFGLIRLLGRDCNGEEIFAPGTIFEVTQGLSNSSGAGASGSGSVSGSAAAGDSAGDSNFPKVLNIDSTLTVTLMPGLPLTKLLPLTSFLMIKKCGVVTEFEVSRQSASVSFDQNWTPESIFTEIEKYTYYELPQNIKINIQEWYSSYSSAMLYYGYILKVTDTNISLAENNPKIKKYIKEKLSEGIYLLNIPAGSDISQFIDESGMDFLGAVKTSETYSEAVLFPQIRKGHPLQMVLESESENAPVNYENKAVEILSGLNKLLDEKDYDQNQKECLRLRISNRMILSEAQLNTAAVRNEILEADGMDFSGKIHLIEAAIKDQNLMEIKMPSPTGDNGFIIIVALPLGISKQPGEAVVRFQIEPTKEIENILVSRITHLRRLRF